MDVSKELGIQSWTFRGFKRNEEVIEKLKECGLSRIELSSAHVNWKDPKSFDGIIKLYRDAGVQISSIGMVGLSGDESVERNYFEFLRKAGARDLVVGFVLDAVPGCYRVAEKLAEEYDMRVSIHNHGGRHWLGSAEILAGVFKQTNERIGLCLDTAWALDSGEDPVKMADAFADRLFGLHIKDFVFDRARKPSDVIVGTGNLDLVALNETLKKNDFDGFAVLEYEGDVNNPLGAVKECVQAIRQKMRS